MSEQPPDEDHIRATIDEVADQLLTDIIAEAQQMEDDRPKWIAVCAPGRRAYTALACMARPEKVVEIRESRYVEGNQVYLLNTDLDFGYRLGGA